MVNNEDFNINLDPSQGGTKQQSLINELMRLINTELTEGDSLPSVNMLSRTLNVSRDTVFKAYSELKRRGVIDSTPTKGYFVRHDISKILLVLDYYSPFKDIVYQELKSNLDDTYSVDLVFHHYNEDLFTKVIEDSIGRYNAYLVMNIDAQSFVISEALRKIDPSKLLFLDIPVTDWGDFQSEKYSYVWQDFDQAVYNALESIEERIKHYRNFVFVNTEQLKHPAITLSAFCRFCVKAEIKPEVLRAVNNIRVEKGNAYFVLRQVDLTVLLSQVKRKGYILGEDVGILVYNDSPLYEFVDSGISVISTDFREMGRMASAFITTNQSVHKILPTRVILRNSL